jgi:predicted HTH transcriptional regulator
VNDGLMEQLLHEGESSNLDYKRDQYLFGGATDNEKSELLKDILAFANGWRHAEAYILIGVEEVAGGRSTVVGVSYHIPENDLQQFVNSKTNRPVTFSYRSYPFEGKQVGVITIPQQDRPLYLIRNFGRLQRHVVYYRQGTTTAIASPDDIARMGKSASFKTGKK